MLNKWNLKDFVTRKFKVGKMTDIFQNNKYIFSVEILFFNYNDAWKRLNCIIPREADILAMNN